MAIRKGCFAAFIVLLSEVAVVQPDKLTIGLVISIDRQLHAYFSQPDLPSGAELRVVGSGERLSLTGRAELDSKTALVRISSNSAFPYLVQGEIESFYAVVLLEDSTALVPPAENLRTSNCTSNEGVHHSLWVVSSESEERVWSAYQQLGYSVEPTCSEGEFAE